MLHLLLIRKQLFNRIPHIKQQSQIIVPLDGELQCCSSETHDSGFITMYTDSMQSPIDFPSYNYLQYLSFKILSPNGETLHFDEKDYTLPFNPNEALNVTLFFEVNEI